MKDVVFFLVGLSVGAVLTLLFAPESGEELRSQISGQAAAEREKLDAQAQQALTRLQSRVDEMHEDLTTYVESKQDAETDPS